MYNLHFHHCITLCNNAISVNVKCKTTKSESPPIYEPYIIRFGCRVSSAELSGKVAITIS